MAHQAPQEKFISKCIQRHGHFYNYDKTIYKGTRRIILVTCPVHGDFYQLAGNHLRSGCSKCARDKSKKTCLKKYGVESPLQVSTIRKKGLETKHLKTKYGIIDEKPIKEKKIKLKKEKKDIFSPDVNKSTLDSLEKLIQEIELVQPKRYRILNVLSLCEITILDTKDGLIETLDSTIIKNRLKATGNLLQRTRLGKSISKEETEVLNFIKENYKGDILENDRTLLYPKEVDVYLPQVNLAIEYNGAFWHRDEVKDKNYHKDKTNIAESKCVRLIHIYEDKWEFKKDIVKRYLLYNMGIYDKEIHINDCNITHIDNSIAEKFIINNDIEQHNPAESYLGLYYLDILVSVLSISKYSDGYKIQNYTRDLKYKIDNCLSEFIKFISFNYIITNVSVELDRSWNTKLMNEFIDIGFILKSETEPISKIMYKIHNVYNSGTLIYELNINNNREEILSGE